MAETISFLPIESEPRAEEKTTAAEEETQEAPVDAAEVTPEAPAAIAEVVQDSVPAPLKRVRAKAAPREKPPRAPKPARKPLTVVTQRVEQVIEPPFERPLSQEGEFLQHMLSHRTRQRAEREELYRNVVGSFYKDVGQEG
jgi:hypothetical protein